MCFKIYEKRLRGSKVKEVGGRVKKEGLKNGLNGLNG